MSISGTTVTLGLASAVQIGETLTLAYVKPTLKPLKDTSGNETANFSAQAATNPTTLLPKAPDVSVTASGSARLTATWTRAGGVVTGYDVRYFQGAADPTNEADWIEEGESGGYTHIGDADFTEAKIQGLAANTAYRVQVRANSANGAGPWASAGATTQQTPLNNTAPRLVSHDPTPCTIDTRVNPHLGTIPDPNGTLVSFELDARSPNPGEGGCTIPFDDPDGDDLIFTWSLDLPAHVALVGNTLKLIKQANGSTRFWVQAYTALEATTWIATITATDPHGASVSAREGFFATASGNTDGAPTFGETVADRDYAPNQVILDLVLPAASGGDAVIRFEGTPQEETLFTHFYKVSGLPPGLSFDAATRTISGTPTEQGDFTVTYEAEDADSLRTPGDTASLTFRMVVGTASPARLGLVRIVSRESFDSDSDGSFDIYIRRDKILVDVEFSEAVEIGGDGNVRLRLDVGADGANLSNSRKAALLDSVRRGGRTLRFAYTVAGSDTDADGDGVWVQTDAANRVLFMPGNATITAAESGFAATLTKSGLPTRGGLIEGGVRARVNGARTSVPGPRPSSATVNGDTLTLTFDKNLGGSVDTDELKFFLDVNGAGLIDGGRGGVYQSPVAVLVSGATLTLTLNTPARAGEPVTVSYRLARAGGLLKGADSHLAPAFNELAVTNNTAGAAGPRPWRVLSSGKKLKLTFTGALDEASIPAGSAFVVTATESDGDRRDILGTGTATVAGKAVTVTLAAAVRADEHVMVSYAKPASAPLQDGEGNAVLAFGHFRVETVHDAVPPALVGGAAEALAFGTPSGSAKVVLYFDEALDADSVLAVGDISVSAVTGAQTRNHPPTSVTVADNAVVLVLTGTGTNLLFMLNDTTEVTASYTRGTNPLRDAAGNLVANFQQQMTARTVGKPVLQSAAVDGDYLTLTYDHPLNPAAVPLPGAFTFHHTLLPGETASDRAPYGFLFGVEAVAVEGKAAVLLLTYPVFPYASAPTVSYAKTNPPHLQSITGTQADAIAHQEVTHGRGPLRAGAGAGRKRRVGPGRGGAGA